MTKTLLFYDLETSGFNPREDKIMQFAGQRTDMDLNPVGEPINYYIKMTEDSLPSIDAVLLTGITPQKTLEDGITEAEFVKIFDAQISQPGTTFVGFNSIRFDDEFMRFFLYRNFYDAYEWQWKNNQSRWDLLDLVRMTRALRPEGIEWPVDEEGKSINKLELLTKANKLSHDSAHDAMSDVTGTIMLAKLIKSKQGKLFDYLLEMRDKKKVQEFLTKNNTFVYCSGNQSLNLLKFLL
ncbi:MAG: exodeoxyribonuclease I, partial [Patescibacteria group bacterium]